MIHIRRLPTYANSSCLGTNASFFHMDHLSSEVRLNPDCWQTRLQVERSTSTQQFFSHAPGTGDGMWSALLIGDRGCFIVTQ